MKKSDTTCIRVSDTGIWIVATSFNNTVKPLFNGNIAETYWKTGTDDILRKYSYSYDNLNRLRKAYFQKPYDVVSHTQSFDEYIDYDKNGNIDRLQRFADHNEYGNVIEIDALGYHYEQHSNKLMKVTDATNFSAGFGDDSDGTNDTDDDYAYDDNGNMISDENKGITTIKYNHLNLPTEISFVNGRIHYLYNATGVKVGKIVIQPGNDPVETDYLGGFQYVKNELQFFPHPEGYVSVVKFGPDNLVINYAYQYKDHLGNIRLNYGKDPETNVLKVLEENHYYPFGLKHQNYNTGRKQYGKKEDEITTLQFPGLVLPTEDKPMVYKYKFQGQERQDELGLNWDSFKWRNYDYAIGRFMNIDPLTEEYHTWSPYVFSGNRVIDARELEGLEPHSVHKTLDEAAINFVSQYNGLSIRMKGEIGTNFYSKVVNNETVYSYTLPVGSPNNAIVDPNAGPDQIPDDATKVGNGHTHMHDVNRVEYDENGKIIYDESNNFSEQDLYVADEMKAESNDIQAIYVGTPNGKALRYTPSGNTGESRSKDIKAVSRDMPRDPSSKTNTQNKVSPNTLPAVLPYGTSQSDVDKLPELKVN